MNDIFYDKIKTLIKTIDLKKVNLKLIKTNSKKLLKIYQYLEKLWNQIDLKQIKHNIYNNSNDEFNQIVNILKDNFLSSNINIINIINKSKYIHCLSYSNIYFYWLSDLGEKVQDNINYELSISMFKISLCLNQYKFNNDDIIPRYIIWIPINKKRDFCYDKITKTNLKKTEENFEAFVASGVTFGLEPRITIITRYEEIEKLLIHELIHNYNMDGSGFHNKLNDILNQYKIIKNNTNGNNKNYHYEYSIYESYTELLSTYFYLLFSNIKSNILLDLNILMSKIIIELIYSYNTIANLINLNGYSNYEEFRSKVFFMGNICKYEYYYIKALMYNNYILEFGNDLKDFKCIYDDIIEMIKKNQNNDDLLMVSIYNNHVVNKNFKYQIH
jgi:hypothetical protein